MRLGQPEEPGVERASRFANGIFLAQNSVPAIRDAAKRRHHALPIRAGIPHGDASEKFPIKRLNSPAVE